MAVTFRNLYRALALALDDLAIQTASSSTTSTAVIDYFVNGTTGASTTRYDGAWVYVSTGAVLGQQHRVRPGGYAPSTGTLTLYPNWSTPGASDELEITRLFPVRSNPVAGFIRSANDDADYYTIANRALGRMLLETRITVSITTADTYSMSAFPWLDRPERLVRVLEPPITSGQRPVPADWRGWRLVVQGTSTHLQTEVPFATASGTLTIDALRPANTLASGVEVTSITSGDSTVDVSIEDFLVFAKAEAYSILAMRPSSPFPNARALADYWMGEMRQSRFYDRTSNVGQPAGEAA